MSEGISQRLAARTRNPEEWQLPEVIHPYDELSLERLLNDQPKLHVFDTLEAIEQAMQTERLLAFGEAVVDRTRWVYIPWQDELVRYGDQGVHRQLRTSRNRPLITREEQTTLYDARVAVFGLSVGSKIVEQLSETGIGGAFLLGDYDTLDITNTNRLRADVRQVGESKVSIAAKKLSIVDPYIEQVHLANGYTAAADVALDEFVPNIIIEEVDDIATKAMIRACAASRGIPVVMVGDLGEKTVADVERYDYGDAKFFNGKLSKKFVQELIEGRTLTLNEKQQALIRLNGGLLHIPARVVASAAAMKRGDIGGIPQLGVTAAGGAVVADTLVRDILLGRNVPSGSHTVNWRTALALESPSTPKEAVGIYKEFWRTRKA
ncbi:MAG: ThiF family adenylyltransferase [Candidatus Saccharimonas sp.]